MTAKLHNTIKTFSLKNYWREMLAVLMLLLAIVFFRSERKELSAIIPHIRNANPFWLIIWMPAGMVIACMLRNGCNRIFPPHR